MIWKQLKRQRMVIQLNKFFEFIKELFGLTEEQVEKAKLTLTDDEKLWDGNKEDIKEEEKQEDGEIMTAEEVKALKEELAGMKALLEQTKVEKLAEQRATKIKSIENCLDYDVLASLLKDVEDKDIDAKVAEIQKEKSYLFKGTETQGFNPATPPNTMTGVEAAFFDLNPDLK